VNPLKYTEFGCTFQVSGIRNTRSQCIIIVSGSHGERSFIAVCLCSILRITCAENFSPFVALRGLFSPHYFLLFDRRSPPLRFKRNVAQTMHHDECMAESTEVLSLNVTVVMPQTRTRAQRCMDDPRRIHARVAGMSQSYMSVSTALPSPLDLQWPLFNGRHQRNPRNRNSQRYSAVHRKSILVVGLLSLKSNMRAAEETSVQPEPPLCLRGRYLKSNTSPERQTPAA